MGLNGDRMDATPLVRAAAELARRWPLEDCPPEVREGCAGAAASTGPWGVLCSGGADSVALLLWLLGSFPERREALRVLHLDHRTRSGRSTEDAAWVERLAAALDLPFRLGHAEAEGSSPSEARLRERREAAIAGFCAEEPFAALFTGHQADDVAENLLLRLARGSGLGGLGGLRPAQRRAGLPVRLRPLLERPRAEIRSALAELGVDWREDAGNAGGAYLRNRLRRDVIPAWDAALEGRSLLAGTRRSHRHLREAEEALEQWAGQFLDEHPGETLPRAALHALPAAVRRRVIARWWRRLRPESVPPGDPALDAALDWSGETAPGCHAAGVLRIESSGTQWRPAPEPDALPPPVGEGCRRLAEGETLTLPDGASLSLLRCELSAAKRRAIRGGAHPCAREAFLADVEGPLTVRGWRDGDRYRPLRAPGRKKLQDAFTEASIPPARRRSLPVVCASSGEVLWVPGLPPAHRHRIRAATTKALWLTYTGS
jgi:tRNA(Ile)-lysidine synthase